MSQNRNPFLYSLVYTGRVVGGFNLHISTLFSQRSSNFLSYSGADVIRIILLFRSSICFGVKYLWTVGGSHLSTFSHAGVLAGYDISKAVG